MANSAPDVCLDALKTYLTAQIPSLTVRTEWPDPNQKLIYPCLTLFQGKITTMNRPPEIVSKTAPDVNNQIVVTEIIGEHDFQVQMDLWCSDRVMRDKYLSLVIDAINAQVADSTGNNNAAGLSLQLTNYYNDWARFDVDSNENVDDAAGVQRRERRAKIILLANCRAIRQRTYYAMINIQSYTDATLSTGALADDASGTDERIITGVP